MANKINTYGYCVCKNVNNIPLHIVEINSTLLWSHRVFSRSIDAIDYINKRKLELKSYGIDLVYDNEYYFGGNITYSFVNATDGLCSEIRTKRMILK